MEIKPAIVVVAYNRAKSLKRLLGFIDSGHYNSYDIPLVISIDYHPSNGDVLKVAEQFDWKYGNKKIIRHNSNLGLREHIFRCGDLSEEYGCVIILEDDAIVSPEFYCYTKEAQNFYQNEEKVCGVSLYVHRDNGYAKRLFEPLRTGYDTFFGQFGLCRGQSWTYKQWHLFREWNKERDFEAIPIDNKMPRRIFEYKKAWTKYFIRYSIENNLYWVVPYEPYSALCGEPGIHSKRTEYCNSTIQVPLNWGKRDFRFASFKEGVKYDIFFENYCIKEIVKKRYGIGEVCLDINEIPKSERDAVCGRYILTTRKLNYHIVDSFALEYRPAEVNVIIDNKGSGIFLYDTSIKCKNKKYSILNRLEYDLGWVKPRMAGLYSLLFGLIYK